MNALAALGELPQVVQLLKELVAARRLRPGQVGFFPRVVTELRAHGHADAVPELVRQALALLAAQPPGQRDSLRYRELQAGVLFGTGRWKEAGPILQALASEYPDEPVYLAFSGVVAAGTGDRQEALRASDLIRDWRKLGIETSPYEWRAAIAAHLGRLDEAMTYLRQARAEGEGLFLAGGPHAHPLLEPLRDYPPFQEFIRPEG